MRESRMIQKSAIGIAVAVAAAVALCYVAIAADLSAEIKPVPVDAEQYADFMETEVLDVQDMANGAEIQRRFFNRITPPGVSLLQPMFPAVAPFTATNFDESFLVGLLGEDTNSVAIYPLSLALDQDTRETLVYNADGKLIATIPADKVSRVWPADADPVRVTLQLNLLPTEDVEPYLYAESRIAGSIASFSKSKPGRTGGSAMRSLGINEFGIADIRRLSNGTMRVTVTNGMDVAELFSYSVLHTSTVVVTIWTNEEQVVITDTNVLWYPVSPSFNGIESEWACGTTNLVLTNGVAVWEDSGISTNDRVRFYAAAKQADTDVDGLTDGTEVFLHRTDPGVADTDLDGHSDGREIALETDPLDGGDYFGIVINAALPIPPPPGSEAGREWVELFNAGSSAKSLAGFRLQTALPAGWTNVFTFPAGTSLDSGDFLVVGNGTNGDFQANLQMPNSSFTPPGVFGIRLVKPTPAFFVADALFYGFTNEYGFSLDGFGEELPILRPWTNWVIRRTWIGYDSDHAGDWKNTEAASWLAHTQGDYLDIDGDGLSNAEEIAGGIYPDEGGSRMDEPDSDFDGLGDADEAANGTNPYHVDSDGDALPWDSSFLPPGNDADELSGGTDPLDPDSDDDGIPDGWELSGGLDPLSPDSDSDAMPDGDEDSDGDGIPNGVEVGNLSNPFDAEDVDPRPYLWDGGDPGGTKDEGDIGYGVTISYAVVAQSNCQSIIVSVTEGGFMEENFSVECEASLILLNPNGEPPRTLIYSIVPDGMTHFIFKVIDGKTTWPNETYPEYGADITVSHGPASLDLDAGVPEESEESVGFLLADKSAHPGAARRPVGINGPSGGYVSNVLLTYDASHLRVYDSGTGGAVIPSGTLFPVEESMPEMYAEGIACSGMRSADMEIHSDINPMEDRVAATVLKADIGSTSPLADDTLHPDAARQSLLLKKTLPSDWNGLMRLSLSGAAAFWTPTGGVPIVLGSTVFTNAQLPQTIYLMGDGCGTGQASFSVVGLPDCVTNIPLQIFGVNATLAGVAENEEKAPGGFIADRTAHTNASRTALTLDACGPYGSSGNLVLSWDPSVVQIYASATGGTAMAQYSVPFAEFNTTNLYVEGIALGINILSWSYSGQPDCADVIQVTVVQVIDIDVTSSISGTSANPPPFDGHTPWPFDVTHSPDPDKHMVIFYKDVIDLAFNVQDFDVTLTANVLPSSVPAGQLNEVWSKTSGPNSGSIDRTDTFEVKYQNSTRGGVYRFDFDIGIAGTTKSEANVILPLAGAEVDSIISADIGRANTFATTVNARYNYFQRQDPRNGLRWFNNAGAGDYLGRPDSSSFPTVWVYNQMNIDGMLAVSTWKGKPIRISKISNFMVAYTARKIKVNPIFAWVSQLIGTPNDASATKSWDTGWGLADGGSYDSTVAALVADIWDDDDDPNQKNMKLWPNMATCDNYVSPNSIYDFDHQFTSPGFLYMTNP